MTGDRNTTIDPGVGEIGSGGARVATFSIASVGAAADWHWLDEGLCRGWLLQQLYPNGAVCPLCGVAVRPGKATDSWWQLRRVRCQACGRFYRATKNTILHCCNLELRQVVMLAWTLSLGLDDSQAAKLASINQTTARLWRHRLENI